MWRFSRHRHVSPCAGTRRCCTPPPPPSRLIAAKRARAKFPRSLRRRVTDGARGAGGQSSRRARGVFIIYATGHETGFPLVWLSAYDRRTPCNIAVAGRRSSVVVCCARRVHRVPTSIVHACARASVSCPSRLVVVVLNGVTFPSVFPPVRPGFYDHAVFRASRSPPGGIAENAIIARHGIPRHTARCVEAASSTVPL